VATRGRPSLSTRPRRWASPPLGWTGGSDTAQATPAATGSDSGTSGLAVTALIVGIVGLLAGIAEVTLALGARRHAAAPAT
jgi:hypothetical protein